MDLLTKFKNTLKQELTTLYSVLIHQSHHLAKIDLLRPKSTNKLLKRLTTENEKEIGDCLE